MDDSYSNPSTGRPDWISDVERRAEEIRAASRAGEAHKASEQGQLPVALRLIA